MIRRASARFALAFTSLAAFVPCATAFADGATPGFPEAVIQWDVQKGESCEDIAKALYGEARHSYLVMRYNRVVCTRGAPLKAGTTLVMPAKVTTVPSAVLTSLVPSVRAKSPGASWGDAAPGMPLSTNANVNTMDKASASIHFIDRTKVFLAENTLVVIFGTASQSAVSKSIPPSVEVDAGEIRTALSALRGDSAEVSVPGGGRVSAASRDTVVERKGERTTVSVFDGKARVVNAGSAVEVPKNFGTRFVAKKPPMPPRPLPPAPEWAAPPGSVLFAVAGKAQLDASWKPVDKARAYRVELATDAAFENLLTREEVPEGTRAFRAGGLPKGSYFLRVRAIDGEDFLGIASTVLAVSVVETVASQGSATVSGDEIVVSPYSSLSLGAPDGALLSVETGPFVPNPAQIDLASTRPKKLTLRLAGADTVLQVRYRMPTAVIDAHRLVGGAGMLRVDLTNVEPELVGAVAPSAKVRRGAHTDVVPLSRDTSRAASFVASVPHVDDVESIEIVDGFGSPLGTHGGFDGVEAPKTEAPPRTKAPSVPRIGVVAPGFGPNPYVVDWSSPTATSAGSVGFALQHGFGAGRTNGQGRAQASGAIGPVGIDGALYTDDLDSPKDSHETAWLGARVRVVRLGNAAFELAPLGRLGVGRGSQTVLGMAGFALGGVAGRVSWLGDVVFQFRPEARPYIPSFVGGVAIEAVSWLRPFANVDVFGAKIDDKTRPGGGLTVGAEAGHIVFGTLSARVSPFATPLGGVSGMLSVGVRAEP